MCLVAKDGTIALAFPLPPPPLLPLCGNVGGNGNDNNKFTLSMIFYHLCLSWRQWQWQQ
jgi:hypothetical protein